MRKKLMGISDFQPNKLPEITHVPPPKPIGQVQINTIPPLSGQRPLSIAGIPPQVRRETQLPNEQLPERPSQSVPARFSAATASQTGEQATEVSDPLASTDTDGQPGPRGFKAPTPPSDVERTASASLLALASSPSGLFKGLSSLFADRTESTAMPTRSMSRGLSGFSNFGAPSPTPPPVPVGFKKSRGSLLDDDEETEEESRLRTVPWK